MLDLSQFKNINGEFRMSSVLIAKKTKKRHDHVIRDIENILTELKIGQPKFGGTYLDKQNKVRPCYYLDERLTIILTSKYSIKMRTIIIDEWLDLKQQQNKLLKQPIRILGRKELLLGNLELLEKNELLEIENDDIKARNEKQQSKIEAQKPAVELAKTIKAAKGSILVRELAKVIYDFENIDIGQNRLYDWFVENGYLMKKPKNRGYEPYQQYMKYFDLDQVTVPTPTGSFIKYTTKINGKGQAYFIPKIIKSFKDGAA